MELQKIIVPREKRVIVFTILHGEIVNHIQKQEHSVDFKEDKNGIKQVVVNFISQIYETKRESAIEVCNKNILYDPISGF